MIDVALELRVGDGDGIGRRENIAQQEFGEGIAAGSLWALGGVRLEREQPARELVADLVVVLPVVLKTECEAVLPVEPGHLVHELQRVVVVGEGAVVGVANPGEPGPIKADVGNSPGDRIAGILAWYTDLGN